MLSVVIPSFNTPKLLNNCLLSLFEQTEKVDYEVIVVDNASNYDIAKQISNLQKKYREKKISLKLIKNSQNLGFARGVNQALKITKADYVLFLNSDTFFIENSLKKCLEKVTKDKIDILGCQLLNSDKTIQPSVGFFPRLRQIFYMMFFLDDLPILNNVLKPYHQQNINFYKSDHWVDWVTGAFLLVSRKVLEKIKGFDEDYFMYAEEVDFCFRAKKAGFKVFYYSQAKLIHLKEASPRKDNLEATVAEFKGLQLFFQKHKPAWEKPFLRVLLFLGSLLRLIFFGILLGDAKKRKNYFQLLALAG